MRITHVVVTDNYAGTERYVSEVATALAERGHNVRVVGGAPTRMPEECGSLVHWSAGSTPRAAWKVLASGGRRDIVHAHLSHADAVAVATAPIHRAAVITTRHIATVRGSGKVARLAGRAVATKLSCELAISRFVAEAMEGHPDEVLHNGVASAESPYDANSRTVLMAQRLEPEKDTATGIRAWAQSKLRHSGWQLLVCGDGVERSQLERLAHDLGVAGTVHFAGWVTDIRDRMVNAGILLATAHAEPLGLSVLEAMAAGIPVVAAASGGHLETIGCVGNAPSFPPGDSAAASKALDRLAASTACRVRLSDDERAVQRRSFSLAAHVSRLEQIYTEHVGGAGR